VHGPTILLSFLPMSAVKFAGRSAIALAALSIAMLSASSLEAQAAPASPRDSVKTTIAGAALKVDYGRPSKRGREVFGGLEKWGNVWRTGANQATHFTTSQTLNFGAASVPAGTYTLYTLLDQGGKWQLIVNKQTGQWGTVYDAKQDLVRIPLTVEQTPAVVEKMEITITPAGAGGELAILWDRTKAKAAFTVAK
jgi:hypothetical protein